MTSSIASGIVSRMASRSDEKVRENRMRRMAERQGLRLEKSRRRDPAALGYGRYMLINPMVGNVVVGPEGVGPTGEPNWTLDDVEAYLSGEGVE